MNNRQLKQHQKPEFDEHFDRLKDSTIMMVDDDPILMEVIKAFLEEEGYTNFITIDDLEKCTPQFLYLQVRRRGIKA